MTIDDIVDYKVKANQEKGYVRGPEVYRRLVELLELSGKSLMLGLVNDSSSTCMNFYLWNESINPVQVVLDTGPYEDVFVVTGKSSLHCCVGEGATETHADVAKVIYDWLTEVVGPR